MHPTKSILFTLALTVFAAAVFAQSSVSVSQSGSGQQTSVVQQGGPSSSAINVVQSGGGNRAIITQSGSGSRVVVRQQNGAAPGDSTRSGSNRIELTIDKGTRTTISQQGPGPQDVTVTQSGNGQTNVLQTTGTAPLREPTTATPPVKQPRKPRTDRQPTTPKQP